MTVQMQDADGRPLSGVWATGITSEHWRPALRVERDSCPAYHVEVGNPRLMVFFEPGRKLAGTLTLKGDEKSPVVVRLGPAGAIKGRLLDADGKPLARLVVDVHYRLRAVSEIHQVIRQAKQTVTDADGAFTVDDLIPQHRFELSFRQGKRQFERETKPAGVEIEVKPGETRELGAIKLKQIPENAGE